MAEAPCPLCGGTGWQPDEKAEGGASTVVRCACQVAASAEDKLRAASIPPRYQHCDFMGFATSGLENSAYNDSLKNARFLAEAFAREYPELGEKQGLGLLLMGPVGVGKTHLAVATLRVLLDRGFPGLFCDFRDLLKQIQDSYNPVSQSTEMAILSPVLETEILVLDDIGAGKLTNWVLDTVGHILNTRYSKRRTTILTTNYLDQPARTQGRLRQEDTLADRIGDRIRSRLYEMCRLVEIESVDFRPFIKRA